MKANVKRPARFSFKTITEKKAKHLTLIFVAVLFLVIVVLALFPLLDREEERYEVTTYAMGSYVQQTVYGENREDAAVKAADAVEALEQKISWRVANSDIQKLNNNAGKDWVALSDETLNVLTQAQSVSEKSGGAFDVTIAPISRLWDFDDELNEVPDSDLITSLLPYVNYSLLRIDETEQTVSLKNLGMAVDLGSVGKGAACDAAVRAAGISAFPMSARIIQKMGQQEDPQNFLLMHAVGANVSGQIASVIAGGIILNMIH